MKKEPDETTAGGDRTEVLNRERLGVRSGLVLKSCGALGLWGFGALGV